MLEKFKVLEQTITSTYIEYSRDIWDAEISSIQKQQIYKNLLENETLAVIYAKLNLPEQTNFNNLRTAIEVLHTLINNPKDSPFLLGIMPETMAIVDPLSNERIQIALDEKTKKELFADISDATIDENDKQSNNTEGLLQKRLRKDIEKLEPAIKREIVLENKIRELQSQTTNSYIEVQKVSEKVVKPFKDYKIQSIKKDPQAVTSLLQDNESMDRLTGPQVYCLATESSNTNEVIAILKANPKLLKKMSKTQLLNLANKHFKIAEHLTEDALSQSIQYGITIPELKQAILSVHFQSYSFTHTKSENFKSSPRFLEIAFTLLKDDELLTSSELQIIFSSPGVARNFITENKVGFLASRPDALNAALKIADFDSKGLQFLSSLLTEPSIRARVTEDTLIHLMVKHLPLREFIIDQFFQDLENMSASSLLRLVNEISAKDSMSSSSSSSNKNHIKIFCDKLLNRIDITALSGNEVSLFFAKCGPRQKELFLFSQNPSVQSKMSTVSTVNKLTAAMEIEQLDKFLEQKYAFSPNDILSFLVMNERKLRFYQMQMLLAQVISVGQKLIALTDAAIQSEKVALALIATPNWVNCINAPGNLLQVIYKKFESCRKQIDADKQLKVIMASAKNTAAHVLQSLSPTTSTLTSSSTTGSLSSSYSSSSSRAINSPEYDYLFKMSLAGDSGVGKSCLLLRFADDVYTESYISTIGVDFKVRTIDIDGKTVKLQVWDNAGQERFRNCYADPHRGAHCVLLIFDLTDSVSFRNIRNYKESVDRHGSDNIAYILVGCKSDLRSKRVVEPSEIEEFAQAHDLVYVETSAKSCTNVDNAFCSAARVAINKMKLKSAPVPAQTPSAQPAPSGSGLSRIFNFLHRVPAANQNDIGIQRVNTNNSRNIGGKK